MAMACPNCGARAPELGARFCSFCGHELPRSEPAPRAPAPRDPADRFRALREHPEFERLQRFVPSIARHRVSALGGVAGGVLFLILGGAMIVPMMVFPPMALALAVMLAFGFFFLLSSVRKAASLSRAELVRVPSRVVDERVSMSGGGESRVRTQYFVSLESERGTREEYEIDERIAGKVAPDDVGVAYFKGALLVDFARVPV